MDYLSIFDYPDLNLSAPEITFMHGNSIEVDLITTYYYQIEQVMKFSKLID